MAAVDAPVALLSRRMLVVAPIILAGLSMIGPFSIDTPFPAFAELQDAFDVGVETTQQLVSTYLLAFAAMCLFHGPLSDAVGRKPVMITGMVTYALASVGCALAPSMTVLLVCRVLQGLCAGAGVIVGRTVIRDLYEGDVAQRLMSRVMMIFSIAPAIAPVIGGALLQVGSWRVIFWFLTGVGVTLAIVVAVVLPETHPPARRTPLQVRPLLAGLVTIARTPVFHRVAWAGALGFGGQFLYIGGAPIFLFDLLHRDETEFWMLFVPMIGCVAIGAWLSGRAAGRISRRRLVTLAFGFAVAAGVVNVVLAFLPTAERLPYAILGPSLIGLGIAAAFPTLQLIVLDLFPLNRGSAASASTFFALILNATTAGLLAPIVTRDIPTLALACLVMVLLGSLLWVWHLRSTARQVPSSDHPEALEPTQV